MFISYIYIYIYYYHLLSYVYIVGDRAMSTTKDLVPGDELDQNPDKLGLFRFRFWGRITQCLDPYTVYNHIKYTYTILIYNH